MYPPGRRRARQRPPRRVPTSFRNAVNAVRPGIRYLGNMGIIGGRRVINRARNILEERRARRQVSEEEIERAQMEAKWRRRQKRVLQLLKDNRKEIDNIIKLLVKNIKITEQKNVYNFNNLNQFKNRRVLESIAITFFEKFGKASNLRNAQVIQKMLVDFDQQISRKSISIIDRSPQNNLLIERQKEQILDNAIREAQEGR